MFHVAALYRFVSLDDLPGHQERLLAAGTAARTCGTLLIAPEGINGTIASDDENAFRAFVDQITAEYGLDPELIKWSTTDRPPFKRYKVRIKREIITLHQPDANPNHVCGTYVDANQWNEIIAQPDMLVLDTRNTYESEIGTFERAVVPAIQTFSQFADYVDQHLDPAKTPNVAMFCTGGIRCEKASSFMLQRGFKNVYHLRGGILKYLEDVKGPESKWNGACFVFDERVAVGEGVAPLPYTWDGSVLRAKPINE